VAPRAMRFLYSCRIGFMTLFSGPPKSFSVRELHEEGKASHRGHGGYRGGVVGEAQERQPMGL
jgi:hypothetical protein